MIELSKATCNDLAAAESREWLITNGIGGYGMGTVAGSLTRRYHGLLVAALAPPLGRTLLLTKLDDTVHYGGVARPLFTNRWSAETVDPHGYRLLESFVLEGGVPTWTYRTADLILEKRIWMEQGANTTYIRYDIAYASAPVTLAIKALVNHRDYHAATQADALQLTAQETTHGIQVVPARGAPFYILSDSATATLDNEWVRSFHTPIEAYRGLDAVEDHFHAATFHATLNPGSTLTLVATLDPNAQRDGMSAYAVRREYEDMLIDLGVDGVLPEPAIGDIDAFVSEEDFEDAMSSIVDVVREQLAADLEDEFDDEEEPPEISVTASMTPIFLGSIDDGWSPFDNTPAELIQLILAADQFIVSRNTDAGEGHSILAGFPWFTDWGRDTMIALPGLTLALGRDEIARSILLTFARYVSQGMIPNRFPDVGERPEYNTVDATLWFIEAVRAYRAATYDDELVRHLFPVLVDIIDWHMRGTRYGIRQDPADGLLEAGEAGVQLTWMDAKVDEWVVTPRRGKPVEINALWYNALMAMAGFAQRQGKSVAIYGQAAARVKRGFQRFWDAQRGYLADVLDTPDGSADWSLRPNQLFAVSLTHSPLNSRQQKAVVDTCARHLLTPHGLRSLAPSDPAYHPQHGGPRRVRDGAYHQGTVWAWLIGPFVEAHFKVYRDPVAAWRFLRPLIRHVNDGCLGSISEIFDGDPPHTPRGCNAQAWSVAEVLRVWEKTQM